jgi:L-threonylcarbamoyladenylate synthase
MHRRHYRPLTPLYLVRPGEHPPADCEAFLRIGQEMPSDPVAYAAALYETLHRLDAAHVGGIAVEEPPATPEWAGVLDRLRRAAQ